MADSNSRDQRFSEYLVQSEIILKGLEKVAADSGGQITMRWERTKVNSRDYYDSLKVVMEFGPIKLHALTFYDTSLEIIIGYDMYADVRSYMYIDPFLYQKYKGVGNLHPHHQGDDSICWGGRDTTRKLLRQGMCQLAITHVIHDIATVTPGHWRYGATACREPGCGKLTKDSGSWCPDHQPICTTCMRKVEYLDKNGECSRCGQTTKCYFCAESVKTGLLAAAMCDITWIDGPHREYRNRRIVHRNICPNCTAQCQRCNSNWHSNALFTHSDGRRVCIECRESLRRERERSAQRRAKLKEQQDYEQAKEQAASVVVELGSESVIAFQEQIERSGAAAGAAIEGLANSIGSFDWNPPQIRSGIYFIPAEWAATTLRSSTGYSTAPSLARQGDGGSGGTPDRGDPRPDREAGTDGSEGEPF